MRLTSGELLSTDQQMVGFDSSQQGLSVKGLKF